MDHYEDGPRLSVEDSVVMGIGGDLLESFLEESRQVIKTGGISTGSAIWDYQGEIIYTETRKQLIRGGVNAGCVLNRTRYMPMKDLYYGAFNGIDLEAQSLQIRPGLIIKRKDLTLLHYVVMGVNYKTICRDQKIGFSALNARLKRLKEKLYNPKKPDNTLQQALADNNLMYFIMAQADWFDMETRHDYKVRRNQ